MTLEKIDFFIRMGCVASLALFGTIAFVFWLIGVSHNFSLSKDSLVYWSVGFFIMTIVIGVGFLALYPEKIVALISFKYMFVIVRIPVYAVSVVGFIIIVRQILSLYIFK